MACVSLVGFILAFTVAPGYQRMAGFLLGFAMLSLGVAGLGATQIREANALVREEDLRAETEPLRPKLPLEAPAKVSYERPPSEKRVANEPAFPIVRIGIVIGMMALLLVTVAGLLLFALRKDLYLIQLGFLVLWGILCEWTMWGLVRRKRWAWLAAHVPFALGSVPGLFFFIAMLVMSDFSERALGMPVQVLTGLWFALFLTPSVLLFSCRNGYLKWVEWATEESPLAHRDRGDLAKSLEALKRGRLQ